MYARAGLRWTLALSALAPACGDSGGDSGEGSALVAQLDGRQFLSEKVDGHALVKGTEIRIRFRGHELSAYAGCNHLSGMFSIEDGALRLLGFGITEIGCDPALGAQDAWLRQLLAGSPEIVFEDPRLTLSTAEARLVLLDRELASPDRPLVGTAWIGNGIGDASAISFGPAGGGVTIDFAADGRMHVFTGCEHGNGGFQADATTISFVALAYDAGAACSNPSLTGLADHVRFVLDGSPVSYAIEEANLTLERAGKRVLFREASASP